MTMNRRMQLTGKRTGLFSILFLSLLYVSVTDIQARTRSNRSAPSEQESNAIEVQVGDMQATPQGISIVLRATQSDQEVYIFVGLNEGEAIARALQHVTMERPMTHDLMKTILDRTGWQVQRVLIRAILGNSYLADLVIGKGGETMTLDARPSDAMALAVRTDAKIYVSQDVIDEQRDQRKDQQNEQQAPDQPESSPDQPGEKGPAQPGQGMHL